MSERNLGMKVYDPDGTPLIETGAHVLKEIPGFAELVGEVAAEWAQAEAFLGCYCAVLQGTTPKEALSRLLIKNGTRIKQSGQIIKELKETAKVSLSPGEPERVENLLERFERVRESRNRVQHDLWTRKHDDSSALYAVLANDFLHLVTNVSETAKRPHLINGAIEMAQTYALTAGNRFTLEDLESLRNEIRSVSIGLAKEFFSHIKSNADEP